MKLVRRSEGSFYQAPKHFNVWSIRKLGESDTECLAVSLSHFLPNGGVEMSGSPSEKMYYIINGSMRLRPKPRSSP